MKTIYLIAAIAGIIVAVSHAEVKVAGKKIEFKKRIEVSAECTGNVMTFGAGDKTVVINVETGKVKWKGMKPDQAARLFWDAVVTEWPDLRKRIIEQHEQAKAR